MQVPEKSVSKCGVFVCLRNTNQGPPYYVFILTNIIVCLYTTAKVVYHTPIFPNCFSNSFILIIVLLFTNWLFDF